MVQGLPPRAPVLGGSLGDLVTSYFTVNVEEFRVWGSVGFGFIEGT